MKIEELNQKLREFNAFQKDYIENSVPEIIGTEAVKHYKQSFVNEGFTDEALEKWPDVKRRDPSSEWYAFSYKANSPKPGVKPKNGEQRRGATNFSPSRANDRVLTGETLELQNSISYLVKPGKVTIRSDKPYSKVQNEGGLAKVFGRTSFQMKARKFIGNSRQLREKMNDKFNRDIKKKREELGL